MTDKIKAFTVAVLLTLLCLCAETSLAQARKSVGAAETNGTFRNYFAGKPKGAYDEIKIQTAGSGKLKVSFDLLYPTRNGGANSGNAEGLAIIAGDTATFAPAGFDQCKITIKFVKPGQIRVTQQGSDSECGFGANVSASGSYKKISRAEAKFQPGKKENNFASGRVVKFAKGETSAVFEEDLSKGGTYKFVVSAKKDQVLAIRTTTDSGVVTFNVTHNGKVIPSSVDTDKWTDKLSSGGDYQINVKRKSGSGKFKIEIVVE